MKIWRRRANIKSYLTLKIDCTLKLGEYEATRYFLHFYARKSNPRRSLEIDNRSWAFTHVLWAPAKPLTNGFWVCFFAGIFGSQIQISEKIQQKYILAKKQKQKKQSVTGWQGFIDYVCQNCRLLSPNNGVDIGYVTNLGRYACQEPAGIEIIIYSGVYYIWIAAQGGPSFTYVWCNHTHLDVYILDSIINSRIETCVVRAYVYLCCACTCLRLVLFGAEVAGRSLEDFFMASS